MKVLYVLVGLAFYVSYILDINVNALPLAKRDASSDNSEKSGNVQNTDLYRIVTETVYVFEDGSEYPTWEEYDFDGTTPVFREFDLNSLPPGFLENFPNFEVSEIVPNENDNESENDITTVVTERFFSFEEAGVDSEVDSGSNESEEQAATDELGEVVEREKRHAPYYYRGHYGCNRAPPCGCNEDNNNDDNNSDEDNSKRKQKYQPKKNNQKKKNASKKPKKNKNDDDDDDEDNYHNRYNQYW